MKTQHSSILSGITTLLDTMWNSSRNLLLLAAGAALLASPHGLAAEPASSQLPSIFVAPLHGDPRSGFWQPAVGDGLAEMLITELHKLGKFRVLESTTTEEIKGEIKMGDDGWIAPDEKVEKGHWKGADYMLVGKITRFGEKDTSYGGGSGWMPIRLPGPFEHFQVTKTEAEVAIDWRIVDTASREVIESGRGNGMEKGTSWGFGSGMGSGFVQNREFRNSALGKATVKAINEIVAGLSKVNLGPGKNTVIHESRSITSGTVEAVTPPFLVVALGEKHGLKPGDRLELCEVNEVHNKKGEVVLRDEKRVGEVIVQSVQADKSIVRVEGNIKPEEGWVVRIPKTVAAESASTKQ